VTPALLVAHESPRDTTAAAPAPDAADQGDHEHGAAVGEGETAYEMPPVAEALVHHLHNKLVHLPIVLTPIALLLLLADRRRSGAGYLATPLIWLAALGAVAAYLAGRAQEEAFADGPKAWLVEVHERWGIAVMITLGLWALSILWPRTKGYRWVLGLVGAGLALVAAFYGGLVAHG